MCEVTKRERGLTALTLALALHVLFYGAMTEWNWKAMLVMGLGFPATVALLGFTGYQVSKWIDRGE